MQLNGITVSRTIVSAFFDKSMDSFEVDVAIGEPLTVENTREVFPNVYVTGMACNAVFGAPRMGPISGGMLMSGKKVAQLINERL